jgi:hypothetical protein
LLKAGVEVYRVPTATEGMPAGAFFIPASTTAHDALAKVTNTGIKAVVASKKPKGAVKINALRIGLWDTYGGSIPSGWLRWLMEQQHFTFERVYAQEIDAGNLKNKYDVLVFVGGAIPSANRGAGGFGGGEFGGRAPSNDELPAEYRTQTGRITPEKSVPQLKAFLEAGGSIVTIGSSANLAYQLKLPVSSALAETVNGQERPLSGDKFYIPGSVLQVTYDTTQPANWGMPAMGDVMFDSSPVFKLGADAPGLGIKPLATYPTEKSLRSGWAWGQKYLKGGVASFVAPVGAGKLYVFGPEITFRAQAHGTFKSLFNQLYGAAK